MSKSPFSQSKENDFYNKGLFNTITQKTSNKLLFYSNIVVPLLPFPTINY